MQIELIGCTSAGKSTLSRGIIQASHEQGSDLWLADDFVLSQIGLNWIKNHLPRTLILNLVGLLACLIAWRKNSTLHHFVIQLITQLPIATVGKLNTLRNVLKRVGLYEIIRSRSADQQIILVDEGVLQAAHYLFVHPNVWVNVEEISTFAMLIPLPDVVVYLRQPESILIDRTIRRGHKRIPDRSYRSVEQFVRQAVTTFENLVRNSAVESKLLVINGGQNVATTTNHRTDLLPDLAYRIVRNGVVISESITGGSQAMFKQNRESAGTVEEIR